MRYLLLDEISQSDMEKINGFLKKNTHQSDIDGLFWVQFPNTLLDKSQSGHIECQPYLFAVEQGSDWIKFELFTRTLNTFQCSCQKYSSHKQKEYIFHYADEMMKELDITT